MKIKNMNNIMFYTLGILGIMIALDVASNPLNLNLFRHNLIEISLLNLSLNIMMIAYILYRLEHKKE